MFRCVRGPSTARTRQLCKAMRKGMLLLSSEEALGRCTGCVGSLCRVHKCDTVTYVHTCLASRFMFRRYQVSEASPLEP